jgi:hypothetical protein
VPSLKALKRKPTPGFFSLAPVDQDLRPYSSQHLLDNHA